MKIYTKLKMCRMNNTYLLIVILFRMFNINNVRFLISAKYLLAEEQTIKKRRRNIVLFSIESETTLLFLNCDNLMIGCFSFTSY